MLCTISDMLPTAYYSHSGITIYNGDSLKILPMLGQHDLLLTDPPYGLGQDSKKVASRGSPFGSNRSGAVVPPTDYGDFDWDSEPASDELIQLAISKANRHIIWGGNYFKVPPSCCWLVWDKQNTGDFADCELAWTNLEKAVRIFRFTWNGMIRQGELNSKPRVHPTQKPTELMLWCLSFVPEALTVIDPFMGSGTSLVAAKRTGRTAVGIEKNERYCAAAVERLAQEVFQW